MSSVPMPENSLIAAVSPKDDDNVEVASEETVLYPGDRPSSWPTTSARRSRALFRGVGSVGLRPPETPDAGALRRDLPRSRGSRTEVRFASAIPISAPSASLLLRQPARRYAPCGRMGGRFARPPSAPVAIPVRRPALPALRAV
ncbi:MAG: hypothetical protein ACLSVD_09960 [Eggerthellaceae bacterium]